MILEMLYLVFYNLYNILMNGLLNSPLFVFSQITIDFSSMIY